MFKKIINFIKGKVVIIAEVGFKGLCNLNLRFLFLKIKNNFKLFLMLNLFILLIILCLFFTEISILLIRLKQLFIILFILILIKLIIYVFKITYVEEDYKDFFKKHKLINKICLFLWKWTNLSYIYNDILLIIIICMRILRYRIYKSKNEKFIKNFQFIDILIYKFFFIIIRIYIETLVVHLKKIKKNFIEIKLYILIKRRLINWLIMSYILLIFALYCNIAYIIIIYLLFIGVVSFFKIKSELTLFDYAERVVNKKYQVKNSLCNSDILFHYIKYNNVYDELNKTVYIFKNCDILEDQDKYIGVLSNLKIELFITKKIYDNDNVHELKNYNENFYGYQYDLYFKEKYKYPIYFIIEKLLYYVKMNLLYIVLIEVELDYINYLELKRLKKPISSEIKLKMELFDEHEHHSGYNKNNQDIILELKKKKENYQKILEHFQNVINILKKYSNSIKKDIYIEICDRNIKQNSNIITKKVDLRFVEEKYNPKCNFKNNPNLEFRYIMPGDNFYNLKKNDWIDLVEWTKFYIKELQKSAKKDFNSDYLYKRKSCLEFIKVRKINNSNYLFSIYKELESGKITKEEYWDLIFQANSWNTYVKVFTENLNKIKGLYVRETIIPYYYYTYSLNDDYDYHDDENFINNLKKIIKILKKIKKYIKKIKNYIYK